MADRSFSKVSSESIVIPKRVSSMLDVICISSIDATPVLLVLNNRRNFSWIGFHMIIAKPIKDFC